MHFGRYKVEHEYIMELGEGVSPHEIEKTLVERE